MHECTIFSTLKQKISMLKTVALNIEKTGSIEKLRKLLEKVKIFETYQPFNA